MHSAVDYATDEVVAADVASHGRRYRCARCYAPVGLRDGPKNAAYFAHDIGKADPDCEDYFGGSYVFTGRRHKSGVSEKASNGIDAAELYFDISASGPMLSLWLPATRRTGQWTGNIDVTAANANRRMSALHLQSGYLVTFPLADGQWNVSVSGDVTEDYISRLDLGPGSLESGLNLFDATQSPGRRLGPAARIRLGDAVWVVTRDTGFRSRSPSPLVTCEQRADVGGWIVLLLELPRECDPDLIPRLRDWLQHPIRLPRARVWIERPFPIRVTPHGLLVFPHDVDVVELRADQSVDLEILETESLRRVLSVCNCTCAEWRSASPGCWTVRANGSEFMRFEVCAEIPSRPPALQLECDGVTLRDLFALQEHVVVLEANNSRSATLRLSWSVPAVGRLARVNGTQVDVPPDALSVELPLAGGTAISASNLGTARWRAAEVHAASLAKSCESIGRLRERARWLLSVACLHEDASERLRGVPGSLSNDDVFGRLLTAAWRPNFAPHVRALAKELEDLS